MQKPNITIPDLLDVLERFYGRQETCWPTDPYEFVVWWHCGYPASDSACHKGWAELNNRIGVEPHRLLQAQPAKLAEALKAGGMVPELRALRLKEIARRVQDEFGGNLHAALLGPASGARKLLKQFPSISDPGADRILLFAGLAPVAAVPSNCPHVLVRIFDGKERENYGATYREGQQLIVRGTPEAFDARTRAYLLLKRHGQETCKRSRPKCDNCPVRSNCLFVRGHDRGVA